MFPKQTELFFTCVNNAYTFFVLLKTKAIMAQGHHVVFRGR